MYSVNHIHKYEKVLNCNRGLFIDFFLLLLTSYKIIQAPEEKFKTDNATAALGAMKQVE